MSHQLVPARLQPRFVSRPWGARRLEPLFAELGELAEPVGEVWLTGEDCLLLAGEFAGRPLGSAWRDMPPEWKGSRADAGAGFPLLVKFLFPDQVLSVQVHPDNEYARRYEPNSGGQGKTELWHAVAARPEAEVLVGLNVGVGPECLQTALANGTIDACLQRIPVAAGDTIFVPAGTVHTIRPGLVLCEIQQQSQLTYRLYDYNRLWTDGKPRTLHVAKALDAIRFGPSAAGKTRPIVRRRPPLSVSYLAACCFFAVERWEFAQPVETATCTDHFDLLVFLAGEGALVAGASCQAYRAGEGWFLPATLGAYALKPAASTILLRAYLPDLDLFEQRLLADGFSLQETSRILFR
jgi:mannose-6-phosphate isomerase